LKSIRAPCRSTGFANTGKAAGTERANAMNLVSCLACLATIAVIERITNARPLAIADEARIA